MAKDRFERYRTLLPIEQLQGMKVAVVGVGAIGRQIGVMLGSMGVRKIVLIDHDVVEEVNLGTQGWDYRDLGKAKVEAAADAIEAKFDPKQGPEVTTAEARFTVGMEEVEGADVVFCCVDSMDARRFIFEHTVKKWAEEVRGEGDVLWVDGRMRGETCRVLTARTRNKASLNRYEGTILPEAEAAEGGCTSRSTFYCASIAAGLMVAQAMKWLRKFPPDEDRLLNILAGEMRDMTLTEE